VIVLAFSPGNNALAQGSSRSQPHSDGERNSDWTAGSRGRLVHSPQPSGCSGSVGSLVRDPLTTSRPHAV